MMVTEYIKGAFYINCIFISTFLGFPNTIRMKCGILVLEIHSHENTGVKTIPKNIHEILVLYRYIERFPVKINGN